MHRRHSSASIPRRIFNHQIVPSILAARNHRRISPLPFAATGLTSSWVGSRGGGYWVDASSPWFTVVEEEEREAQTRP